LEIFAVSFRAVAFFESPKKESWRASPLLATQKRELARIAAAGDEESTSQANYHVRV
jgi:hypothetical protein